MGAQFALPFQTMEQTFSCSRDALRQSRITFWFYAASIPIIIFLFLLPFIRAGSFALSPYSLIYIAIILYLIYSGYRSMRVLLSIKNSHCVVENDRIYGVSTPSPVKKAIPFDIRKSDILSVAKTNVSCGGMRSREALVLNTQDQRIVLFAIERMDELQKELSPQTAQ